MEAVEPSMEKLYEPLYCRLRILIVAGYEEDEALTILSPSAGHERPVVHGVESLDETDSREVAGYQLARCEPHRRL